MTTELTLALLAATAVLLVLVEVLREVLADRPTHQPRSHVEDSQFRPPGAWS